MKHTEQDLQELHDRITAVQETEGRSELFWELIGQYHAVSEALKPYVINNREIIEANIDNYISLKGHGIMDGLKVHCKRDLHKIIGYDSEGNLVLHRYQEKRNAYLPPRAQDQEYKIYTAEEYKQLPSNY